MRSFLLGILTALLVAAGAGGALVLSVSSDSPASGPTPSAHSSSAPRPPTTVGAGDTWLGVVDVTSSEVLTDGGGFTDVTATGHGVTVSEGGIHADRLDLDVTLPWATAAAQVGPGVELYAAGPGRAGLSRTLELLGQQVPVRATGTVRAEGGQLVIEPEEVDLEGPDWLDSVASAGARALVTIRQPVQGVPAGMRLESVSVIDSGFRAALTGQDVTLAQ